jgi:hypothetical protein
MPAPTFPGLGKLTTIVNAYNTAWQRNVDAINQAWADATSDTVSASSVLNAWSQVVHTWSESAQDIMNAYMGQIGSSSASGRVLTFVLDKHAEASAGPQCVPIPAGVDGGAVVATPLWLITPPSGDLVRPSPLQLLADKAQLAISVPISTPYPTAGTYISTVYEPKAGDPTPPADPAPPARPALATVMVTFLP